MTLMGGKFEIHEDFGQNVGTVRSFIATGRRGAQYGCMLYDDGRFLWINLRNMSYESVPFDLAQWHPTHTDDTLRQAVQS